MPNTNNERRLGTSQHRDNFVDNCTVGGCLGVQILSQFPVQLCWKKGWRFQNSPIVQLEIPNLESVSCNALEISLVFHFPWSSAAGPTNAFVLGLFYGFLVYQGQGGVLITHHANFF